MFKNIAGYCCHFPFAVVLSICDFKTLIQPIFMYLLVHNLQSYASLSFYKIKNNSLSVKTGIEFG